MLCVCVPEGGAVGQCVEDRRVKVAELQTVFRRSGFPFHVLPLEQVSVGAAASLAPAPPQESPLNKQTTTVFTS